MCVCEKVIGREGVCMCNYIKAVNNSDRGNHATKSDLQIKNIAGCPRAYASMTSINFGAGGRCRRVK